MIMASILVGIVAGVVSFMAGLVSGQGLMSSVGLYVMGGFVGMLAVLVLGGLSRLGRGRAAPELTAATVQG